MKDHVVAFAKALALVLILVIALVIPVYHANLEITEEVCTVVDKYPLRPNLDHDYVVITTTCGQLRITDSLLDWDYGSLEMYNMIRVGETYKFTLRTLNVPWLLTEPTIIAVEPV